MITDSNFDFRTVNTVYKKRTADSRVAGTRVAPTRVSKRSRFSSVGEIDLMQFAVCLRAGGRTNLSEKRSTLSR